MIIDNITNKYGFGEIIYDNGIFKIICVFMYAGLTHHSDIIINSSFEIYDKDEEIVDMSGSIHASEIWKHIFEIKKLHYDKYKPSVVQINILPEYASRKRIDNYIKYLDIICEDTGKVFNIKNTIYYGIEPDISNYQIYLSGFTERYIMTFEQFVNFKNTHH
jgi:hypothetical protein